MNATQATVRRAELSPALQMRRAAIERRAQQQDPKRHRAVVTFIVVCVVGAMLMAGAYLSMSEMRNGAWEKPSTAQDAPASVTTESTTPTVEPAPVAVPAPAAPVEATGGYVVAPVTP